jgi:glycosyltransferase involved in cell wall biosynthesis
MKIAVIAPSGIPARRANTIQVMKMAQSIQSLGHSVRLAVPQDNQSLSEKIPDWDYLKLYYGLQSSFPIEWLRAYPVWRRYDFSLRAVGWVRAWHADLLYTRLPQAAALASILGIPTLLEVHDMPQGTLGPQLFRAYHKGKGACRMVVITHALAQDLADRFGIPNSAPRTIIAPDGVDLERYENLPPPEQARAEIVELSGKILNKPIEISIDRFTVGYTGHLYPGRGTTLLLQLAEHLPDINFLIAGGEPNDVQRFKAEISTLGISNVHAIGFVPNADLPRFQAACEVLLMPYQSKVSASSGGDISRYLSPMKLFEYMACERAIVSSDLPVFREVLSTENSILLPPQDIKAWENCIRSLRADSDHRLRLASQARRDVFQYTWETRTAKILDNLRL